MLLDERQMKAYPLQTVIFCVGFQQQILKSQFAMFDQLFNSLTTNTSSLSQQHIREKEYTSTDLQYEICSRFMKITSEQLYQKEIEIMQATSRFIEKVGDSLALKDISSTQESLTLEPFLQEEDPFSQPTKSKLLLRKSQSNSSLRRSDSGMTESLRQVQKKCSQRTSTLLSNMFNQFRRLKEKVVSSERIQKDMKKLEARCHTSQEELLLIKKRISDLEKQNRFLQDQTLALRKKLKQANEQVRTSSLSLSKSSDSLKMIGNLGVTQKLRKYLQQKEVNIFKKEKQVKNIHDCIQKTIQVPFKVESCQKCCSMMKRIKDSVIQYRSYLQEQYSLAESLYQNYKIHFS